MNEMGLLTEYFARFTKLTETKEAVCGRRRS